jgi:hypothetical protein
LNARDAHRLLACAACGALGLTFGPHAALAYCPSYTPEETSGGQNCGVEPVAGANPSTAAWTAIFATVAPGSASWGASGPTIGTMGAGCGKPTPHHEVPAHFPCHVLQAITMQESGWRQFCVPDAPASSVGAPERTIVAFDCGYGVGQVTSGMHVGESPAFDRARVASDPTYNLATGTLILRDKWAATSCVGDNDPDVVEDWYAAIWAYNGLAYSNNPNNPNLTAGRGVYDPTKGGSYTYQERVLGWMEHPPTSAHWPKLAPAYPNPGDVGGAGAPPALPEPSCASPTDCTTTRATHHSTCGDAPVVDGGADGAASGDAGAQGAIDAGSPDGATPAAPVPEGDADVVPIGAGPSPPPPGADAAASGCGCAEVGRSAGHGSAIAWFAATVLAGAARVRRSRRRARCAQ